MAALMDIEEEDEEIVVETVLEKMWRYCQTYSIGNAGSVEDRQPHWYVMDEFGSRVPHGDMPTYRMVPFIYSGDGLGYTLLFPVSSMAKMAGAEVTRDYIEGEVRDGDTEKQREGQTEPDLHGCR